LQRELRELLIRIRIRKGTVTQKEKKNLREILPKTGQRVRSLRASRLGHKENPRGAGLIEVRKKKWKTTRHKKELTMLRAIREKVIGGI